MNISTTLQLLLNKQDLPPKQMRNVMYSIMSGKATSAQIAGFLIALRCKGETVDEITVAARVMRELASPIAVKGKHIIDTCGTGGDGMNTFNISTTCAFVVAAAGGKVAKHGNRSVSSRSGSADVLEAAGVNIKLDITQVSRCVDEIGVGFLFAPKHHKAMKHAIAPRKEMGIRTLFNLLGPLSNPANVPNQLLGVFAKQWVLPLAKVLQNLGSQHVLVVNAEDGLDEISIATPTTIAELNKDQISSYSITPEQFGLQRTQLSSLVVDGVSSSLAMVQGVLAGKLGPAHDIVCLNAGAAIYAANLSPSLASGIKKASQLLTDGAATDKLQQLITLSHRL